MELREDVIHYYMRRGLRELGWILVAGQFPNGSDDELRALQVVDPSVARDRSPRPRQHALDKLVPDLVAYKSGTLLVIEAKPTPDLDDEIKLKRLLSERCLDFYEAVRPMLVEAGITDDVTRMRLVPALAFTAGTASTFSPNLAYIEVGSDGSLVLREPEKLI